MMGLPSRLTVVGMRSLDLDHTLAAVLTQHGKRPSKNDAVTVWCSCGERVVCGLAGQEGDALDLAATNHQRHIAQAVDA